MAYLSKPQLKQLLETERPSNPAAFVRVLINQGHQIEGFNAPENTSAFDKNPEEDLGFVGNMGRAMAGNLAELGTKVGQTIGAREAAPVIGQENIESADLGLKAAKMLRDPNTTPQQREIWRKIAEKSVKGFGQTFQEDVNPVLGDTTTADLTKTGAGAAKEAIELLTMAGGLTFGSITPAYASANPVKAAIIGRYIPTAVTGVTTGALSGTEKAIENKEDFYGAAKDVAISSLLNAGLNVAVTGALDAASWAFKSLYSKLSGVPKRAVDQLVEGDTDLLKRAREVTGNDPKAQAEILDEYKAGVQQMKDDTAKSYQDFLKQSADRTYVGVAAPPDGFDPQGLPFSGDKKELADAFRAKANSLLNSNGQVTNQELYDFYNYNADLALNKSTLSAAEKAGKVASPLNQLKKYAGTDTPDFDNQQSLFWRKDDGTWEKTNLTVGGLRTKIRNFIFEPLAKNGYGVKKLADGTLDFTSAKIGEEAAKPIEGIIKTVNEWDDFTPIGLNALRQRLNANYDAAASTNADKMVNRLVIDVRDGLDSYLSNKIGADNPIILMNKDYSSRLKATDAILTELGKPAETQAAFEKLRKISLMKDNLATEKMLGLDKATKKQLLKSLDAYAIGSWANRNKNFKLLEQIVGGGGLVTAGVTGTLPQVAPAVGAGMVLASPRAGAEAINASLPVWKALEQAKTSLLPFATSQATENLSQAIE